MEGKAQDLVLILADKRIERNTGTGLGLADQVHLKSAALRAAQRTARIVLAGVLAPCSAHCSGSSHVWRGLYPPGCRPG